MDSTDHNSATLFDYNTLETLYPEFVEDFNSTNKTGYSDPVNECYFFGDRYWYHPDYLGSVAMVTNDEGVVHQFFLTNAWGEELHTYNNANTSSFNSEYSFNDDGVRSAASIERCARSAELDEETGLAYYGARYYDNKISMWLSVDAMAMEPHNMPLSPYHFSANNPITNIDPDGNDWFINSETGDLLLVKGADWCEHGDQWKNIGKDDMFGADISLEGGEDLWYGVDILFSSEAVDEFLSSTDYTRATKYSTERLKMSFDDFAASPEEMDDSHDSGESVIAYEATIICREDMGKTVESNYSSASGPDGTLEKWTRTFYGEFKTAEEINWHITPWKSDPGKALDNIEDLVKDIVK